MYLGVAQLVAHKTGGLGVAGSSPVTQTKPATSLLGRNKKGSTKVPPFLIASFCLSPYRYRDWKMK